ncbi:MAG: SMI1/KNR4 family protein [Verrucomicrobiaceae bacterium]|nr:SMI1/KNR4 family protein [Verrucomicrobiaceae bacterium]
MKSLISSFFRRANSPPPIPDERSEHFTKVMLPAMGAEMELRNEFGEFEESAYERFKQEAGRALPPDYEAYLRAYNGGLPRQIRHPFGFLFSMQTQEMEASLLSTLHWPPPPGKTNWLVIGRDGAMGLYFMSLNAADFGSIHSCFAFSDEMSGEMSYMGEPHQVSDSFGAMFRVTNR